MTQVLEKVCILVFLVSDNRIRNFFDPKRSTNKISCLLDVSNSSSKSEKFSLNDIEVLVDKKEQNRFKKACVGKVFRVSSHPKVNGKAGSQRS